MDDIIIGWLRPLQFEERMDALAVTIERLKMFKSDIDQQGSAASQVPGETIENLQMRM
jgi:hypothetical protein